MKIKEFGICKITTITIIAIIILLANCEEMDIIGGENPYWDSDGDGISNCVENNNANSHHNFNPDSVDQNPSVARGYPWDGSLEGGINLCDEEEGYYHFYALDTIIDSDDWGTLALINMIEGSGRRWNKNSPPRIGIGDMSKKVGGYWYPHSSHQNGLDVDIRYVRNDDNELPIDLSKSDSIYYDRMKTIYILNYFFNASYQETFSKQIVMYIVSHKAYIVLDTTVDYPPGITAPILKVDSLGNHDTHIHIRIKDPDGTGN